MAQNRVFETQDVSKIYTFETVPTNYIVRKMGLIPNFGQIVVKHGFRDLEGKIATGGFLHPPMLVLLGSYPQTLMVKSED